MNEDRGAIQRLKQLPRLFRKQDVEKISRHANMFLTRAVKKGIVHRINRGNYINSFHYGFPAVEQVACFLRPTGYISCEWALNYHGVSLQSPTVCTLVTLNAAVGKNRNIQYQGVTIEFSKISSSLFFGFVNQDGFFMASAEKAILDTLYYRGTMPAYDELDLDHLDLPKLEKMSIPYPKSIRKLLQTIPNLSLSLPNSTPLERG